MAARSSPEKHILQDSDLFASSESDDQRIPSNSQKKLTQFNTQNTAMACELTANPMLDSCDISYGTMEREPKLVGYYILGEKLGEGAFGKVREAMDSRTLRRVAVKILKKAKIKRANKFGEEAIKNEINIMRKLKHRNVIELLEVINDEEKGKLYIVLEFAGGGSLQDLLDNSERGLTLTQVKNLFSQLLDGLEYIHSQGVVHRDIKPGNLMLTADGVLKISDFGVAQMLDTFNSSDTCTASHGSPAFQSPQIATGRDCFSGFKLDIWAAGVTLYLLVTGQFPFQGANVFNLFENIAKAEYQIPAYVPAALRSLIEGMMDPNEDTRLTIAQIKRHQWMIEAVSDDILPARPHNSTGTIEDRQGLSMMPYIQRIIGDEATQEEVDAYIRARGDDNKRCCVM